MVEAHLLLYISITLLLSGIITSLTVVLTLVRCTTIKPHIITEKYHLPEFKRDTQETAVVFVPPTPLIYRMVSEIAVIMIEPDDEKVDRSAEKAHIQRLIQHISRAG